MSFTPTFVEGSFGPYRPGEGTHEETWKVVNTAGSSGGVVTARHLKSIDFTTGNYLTRTISGKTVTVVMDVNSSGEVRLYGRT